ncbi:MAG: DUF2785 domain-containing protein [Pseudomonadota bacterium]
MLNDPIRLVGRMGAWRAALLVACALGLANAPSSAETMPDRAELEAWRDAAFQTDDPKGSLMQLAGLMGEVDPFLRDEIGFTGLSAILRRGSADPATVRRLIAVFTARLDKPDPVGVRRSFAILGLSELARVDRLEPFLSDEEFSELVAVASAQLSQVTDYRGYDPDVGWRHAVAHGSDFALQLVLNDRTDAEQLALLREAVAAQIAPGVAYVNGESQRLARPILYMALREASVAPPWGDWFEALAQQHVAIFEGTETTVDGLSARHNLRRFLLEIYTTAKSSDREALAPLADGALALLRRLGG